MIGKFTESLQCKNSLRASNAFGGLAKTFFQPFRSHEFVRVWSARVRFHKKPLGSLGHHVDCVGASAQPRCACGFEHRCTSCRTASDLAVVAVNFLPRL